MSHPKQHTGQAERAQDGKCSKGCRRSSSSGCTKTLAAISRSFVSFDLRSGYRNGSKGEILAASRCFRFGPNNGHRSIGSACLFGALPDG
jgi:hypothetical protein